MPDDSTFFSIAAALLPTLMLAGLLSDKLKPPKEKSRTLPLQFGGIAATGVFFVAAEVGAITAAISGEPSDLQRWVVSIALILAAIGTVLLVLLPWIERFEQKRRWVPTLFLAALFLAAGVPAVLGLNEAVEDASLVEDLQANKAASDRNLDALERLLTEQRRLYAQEDRLQRDRSRLILQEVDLLTGPRGPDTRGRRFLLREQLRSVEDQLDALARERRRLTDEFVRLSKEAERINKEAERLAGAS